MKRWLKYTITAGIFFVSGFLMAHAQKEGAVWYFGQNAGLDFNLLYPRPLTDGKLNTREGVASIASSTGDLLFYTDGSTVYNKNHQIMQDGTDLYGNMTSTQSSIIVPMPGNGFKYYIFTVDKIGSPSEPGHGLNYSVVDMLQNNGLGRVVEKNRPLLPECTEKITAVKHDNDQDYWIIAHGWNSWAFYVFQLNSQGVRQHPDPTLYEQLIGSEHRNTDPDDQFNRGATGYLKSSPQGDYLVVAVEALKQFELFDFDSKTGEISNPVILPAGDDTNPLGSLHPAYGVEFSPTGNYLYGSTRKGGYIYRWDLTLNSADKIRSSMQILRQNKNVLAGAMQLAFNGKIYVSFGGQQYLGVINSPTQPNCKFEEQGASLYDNEKGVGGKGYYGLPTFLPDFFKAAEFYFENTCVNDTTLFYLSTIFGLSNNPSWKIYDINSNPIGDATINTDTKTGTFIFKNPGEYIVELDVTQWGARVVQRRVITIFGLPELNFADTTILCQGKNVTLDAGYGAFYNWSDNQNLLDRFRVINKVGSYSVLVTHYNGCSKSDTTRVVEKPLPVIKNITVVPASCGSENGQITIVTEGDPSEYLFEWADYPEHTSNVKGGLGANLYNVTVTSKLTGCPKELSVEVNEYDAPPVQIISDVEGIICPGTEVHLEAQGATSYEWYVPAGDTNRLLADNPYYETIYIVKGTSWDLEGKACSAFARDTIRVYPYDPPQLGSDRSLCEGNELELDGGADFLKWEWYDGDSLIYDAQKFTLTETIDSLILYATDVNQCIVTDSLEVLFKAPPEVDLGEDRAVCKSTPIELDAGEGEAFLWNTGDTTQTIEVIETGIYEVAVTRNGCPGSDEVVIRVNDPDSLRIDSVGIRDISCFGASDGELRIYAHGEGSIYSYSIDDEQNFWENQGLFTDLKAGSYFVTVEEDSACNLRYPTEIEVTQPDDIAIGYKLISPSCDLCEDGEITLDISGGTLPYDILWFNMETSKKLQNLALGEYPVWITDAKGCTQNKIIEMEMGHAGYFIPNAFTPNGDGINETWEIKALSGYPESLVQVYDRFGSKVFESERGYPEPWNGTDLDGQPLPMGSYFYLIYSNEVTKAVKGTITIIR